MGGGGPFYLVFFYLVFFDRPTEWKCICMDSMAPLMDEGCTVEWSVSAPCLPFVTAVGLRGILRGFFRGPRLACLPTKMAADVVSPGASSSGHVTVVHFFSAAGLCKFLPFRP